MNEMCKKCGHIWSTHQFAHIPNHHCNSCENAGRFCGMSETDVKEGLTEPRAAQTERLERIENMLTEVLELLQEQKIAKWAKENL